MSIQRTLLAFASLSAFCALSAGRLPFGALFALVWIVTMRYGSTDEASTEFRRPIDRRQLLIVAMVIAAIIVLIFIDVATGASQEPSWSIAARPWIFLAVWVLGCLSIILRDRAIKAHPIAKNVPGSSEID